MDNIALCETPVSRSSGPSKAHYSRLESDEKKKALAAVRRVIDFGNPSNWSAKKRGLINVRNCLFTKEQSPVCPILPKYLMDAATPTKKSDFKYGYGRQPAPCGNYGDSPAANEKFANSPAKRTFVDEETVVERRIIGVKPTAQLTPNAANKKSAFHVTMHQYVPTTPKGNPNVIQHVDRSGIKERVSRVDGRLAASVIPEPRSTVRNRVPHGQTRRLASLFENMGDDKNDGPARLRPAPRTQSVPPPRFQFREFDTDSSRGLSQDDNYYNAYSNTSLSSVSASGNAPKPTSRITLEERNPELRQVEVMRSEEGVRSLARKLEDSGFLCCSPSAPSLKAMGSPAPALVQRPNLESRRQVSVPADFERKFTQMMRPEIPDIVDVVEENLAVESRATPTEAKPFLSQVSKSMMTESGGTLQGRRSLTTYDSTETGDTRLYGWGDEHDTAPKTITRFRQPSYTAAKCVVDDVACVELCDTNYLMADQPAGDQYLAGRGYYENELAKETSLCCEGSPKKSVNSFDEMDHIGVVEQAFSFVNEVELPVTSSSNQPAVPHASSMSIHQVCSDRPKSLFSQQFARPPRPFSLHEAQCPMLYKQEPQYQSQIIGSAPASRNAAARPPQLTVPQDVPDEATYANIEKRRGRTPVRTAPIAASTPVNGSPIVFPHERIPAGGTMQNMNRSFVSTISSTLTQDGPMSEDEYAIEIKRLKDSIFNMEKEAHKAVTTISRCKKTAKMSGSFVELCAQRELLLARERQVMMQREVQRIEELHLARKSWSLNSNKRRGVVSIYSITLFLNRNFCLRNVDEHDSYAFVIVVKTNEQVEATELVTLVDPRTLRVSSVQFGDHLQFENLLPDFSIKLEVYALKVREMPCLEDRSCALLKNKAKLWLSPRKHFSGFWRTEVGRSKAHEVRKTSANVSVVSTTGFTRCGYTCLTKDLTGDQKIYLDATEYPLEGTIEIRSVCNSVPMTISIDFSGFLTMYEIITGFGSWCRYWAALRQGIINFWKYPSDEAADKPPLIKLDLSRCTKTPITQCNLDECCRKNTFALDIVMQANATYTSSKRILLSADSKELCEAWVRALNDTLKAARG